MSNGSSPLGAEHGAVLLRLARRALEEHLGRPAPEVASGAAGLLEDRSGGLFVTLRCSGELRGCIGHVASPEPLSTAVVRCAVAAATEDPRFPPVTRADLPAIRIEVSVLSPLHRVGELDEIRVGRDGLLVERDGRRGLLLPQVAGEAGWGRDRLLEGVCRKAGLPADAWRTGAVLYRFSAQVFQEPEGS